MAEYRESSTSEATTSDFPVRPAPVSVVKSAPTRFAIRDPGHNQKSRTNAFTVEDEFKKYVSVPVSSKGTDILQFWEVRRFT